MLNLDTVSTLYYVKYTIIIKNLLFGCWNIRPFRQQSCKIFILSELKCAFKTHMIHIGYGYFKCNTLYDSWSVSKLESFPYCDWSLVCLHYQVIILTTNQRGKVNMWPLWNDAGLIWANKNITLLSLRRSCFCLSFVSRFMEKLKRSSPIFIKLGRRV